MENETIPANALEEEKKSFRNLQNYFSEMYPAIFPDILAEKTVVILPSLTLDNELLSKLRGHIHYEERMLCLLLLLRMPRTRLIYLSSIPIDDEIISYYLHLLQGVTGRHARQRLTLLSCHDASSKPLTQKILERPRLIQRIKAAIADTKAAHITCFNVTALERTLAVQLEIPIYGTDPDLLSLGTKSGSRKVFQRAGVLMPKGFEDLKNREEVIESLATLKAQNPQLRKAVVKTNDGFGGEGNAVYQYPQNLNLNNLKSEISSSLHEHLNLVLKDITLPIFFKKFEEMGGIVEEFIEGEEKTSPSVQCKIDPGGKISVVSTHDQLLDGHDAQVFLGAHFPADEAYNIAIARDAKAIAHILAEEGALGRFSIDFVSTKNNNIWKNYCIEINLRKGGTTHPFLIMQYLSNGMYDDEKGFYLTASGARRYYFSTDNIVKEGYKGLTPQDLVDIVTCNGLLYDGAAQEGVMFHMVGALSQYGKLGVVCIGATRQKAIDFFNNVIRALDKETGT